MRITLITACWNSEKTIADTMASVLNQRDADIDYIVADGGSSDGTVEVIREYEKRFHDAGRSFRWFSGRDRGMYDAINKGIAISDGDVIGILNADDVFESEMTISHVAAAFDDGVEAVYADIRFVRELGEDTIRYYSGKRWRPWMFRWGFMPPHPSVYIRKANFARLGGYSLDYRISADFELMLRFLCKDRIKTKYMDECLVVMRTGGASTRNWRANVKLNQENVAACRANGYFCTFAMMLPKYLFKVWGYVFTRSER